MRPILVTHIMKTGGTSLRRMLVDAVGADRVYPNDEDLAARPHGFYPGPQEFVELMRSGQTHDANIFIGHFPFVLREAFQEGPLTVTLLRDPVARTLSMLNHRKLKSPRFAKATYSEMLYDPDFVNRQIRDYQTKIFAFDSIRQCPDSVNVPFHIDTTSFDRALTNLNTVDVLGFTEDMRGFCKRFRKATDLEIRPRTDNVSASRDTSTPSDRTTLTVLIRYDLLLYEVATRSVIEE